MYMIDVELYIPHIYAYRHTYIHKERDRDRDTKRQRQREAENHYKHPGGKGHLEQDTE